MDNLLNAAKNHEFQVLEKVRMEYKIYNKGTIEYEDGYYFDQLSGLEIIVGDYTGWIHKSQFRRYLLDTYNLSMQEYYNIVMGFPKDYQPNCAFEDCSEKVKFISPYKGYNKTCCRSHQVMLAWQNDPERHERQAELMSEIGSEFMDKYWNSPEYEEARQRHSERMSERMTKQNLEDWQNPEYREAMTSLARERMTKEAKIELDKLNAWNYMEEFGYIYLMYFQDKLKIGVSSTEYSLSQRVGRLYPTGMKTFKGKSEEIVETEAEIKLAYEALEGTLEYFPKELEPEILNKLSKFESIKDWTWNS